MSTLSLFHSQALRMETKEVFKTATTYQTIHTDGEVGMQQGNYLTNMN